MVGKIRLFLFFFNFEIQVAHQRIITPFLLKPFLTVGVGMKVWVDSSESLVEFFSRSNICLICSLRGFEFSGESTGTSQADLIEVPSTVFLTCFSGSGSTSGSKLTFSPVIPSLTLERTIGYLVSCLHRTGPPLNLPLSLPPLLLLLHLPPLPP